MDVGMMLSDAYNVCMCNDPFYLCLTVVLHMLFTCSDGLRNVLGISFTAFKF